MFKLLNEIAKHVGGYFIYEQHVLMLELLKTEHELQLQAHKHNLEQLRKQVEKECSDSST